MMIRHNMLATELSHHTHIHRSTNFTTATVVNCYLQSNMKMVLTLTDTIYHCVVLRE